MAKLRGILDSEIDNAKQAAHEKKISPDWFLANLDILRKNSEASMAKRGAVVSLFE
mgnify:CR=1 FL=1